MTGDSFGYDDYLSPFTWRYGSKTMRGFFSEKSRRTNWRKVWLALAEAESEFGLLSPVEVDDIRRHSGRESVDIRKAHELEKEIRHDLMAELRSFAGQAKKGGGKLHLGATSMDIEDNADILAFQQALGLIVEKITGCLVAASMQILKHNSTVCMGWTHLQPAEPTTLGYRISGYAQDLLMDAEAIEFFVARFLRGKGVKGAVGTSASYAMLLGGVEKPRELESKVLARLGLSPFEVSAQTYPRKVDFLMLSVLSSVAQSCYKFGLDMRVLQSPAFGELSEPIGSKQVGSSAMPSKRNPVSAERMCSLARFVSVLPMVAQLNASNSILERTLDDSAARRIAIPEAFLAVDECLEIYARLMRGLVVYPVIVKNNLEKFGPFAGTEGVLMRLSEKGGDRQALHERIRSISFKAWSEVMGGKPNPLEGLLAKDPYISKMMSKKEIHRLLDSKAHIGDSERRSVNFVKGSLNPFLSRHRATPPSARKF